MTRQNSKNAFQIFLFTKFIFNPPINPWNFLWFFFYVQTRMLGMDQAFKSDDYFSWESIGAKNHRKQLVIYKCGVQLKLDLRLKVLADKRREKKVLF